jgi:hypothetical protein
MGRVDCDLVVCGIAILHSEIIVFDVNVQVREDELFLDHVPDDAGLFVAIEFNDRIGDLDLFDLSCRQSDERRNKLPDIARKEVAKVRLQENVLV